MSSRPPAFPPASPLVDASPPPSPPIPPARQDEAGADDSANIPWPWRLYGGLAAHLGLPIIAAWIAAAVATVMFLPDFGAASGFGLIQLVPSNTAAVRAQATEQRLFGASLADSPALIVEHAQHSIPAATLVKIGRQAQVVDGLHSASSPPHQPSF